MDVKSNFIFDNKYLTAVLSNFEWNNMELSFIQIKINSILFLQIKTQEFYLLYIKQFKLKLKKKCGESLFQINPVSDYFWNKI